MLDNFNHLWEDALTSNELVKITFSNYNGDEFQLKKLFVKPIILKKNLMLNWVYRYQTKDITKNYTITESKIKLDTLILDFQFGSIAIFTLRQDYYFNYLPNKKSWKYSNTSPSEQSMPTMSHNKEKNYKLNLSGQAYLYDLNVADQNGHILKSGQDKYKQISNFIEILDSHISALSKHTSLHIVDMGCGKGYLTFALYQYLTETLSISCKVIGVEFRQNLIDSCNSIAQKYQYNNLLFEQGEIANYSNNKTDVLIALHACDTATDDAIYYGIINEAKLIVISPCCHKEVRKSLNKSEMMSSIQDMTKYGIFMERQCEMVTDTIRSLLLEKMGYSVKIVEYISSDHTAKNTMIIAEKKNMKPNIDLIQSKIDNLNKLYGLKPYYLERKLM